MCVCVCVHVHLHVHLQMHMQIFCNLGIITCMKLPCLKKDLTVGIQLELLSLESPAKRELF